MGVRNQQVGSFDGDVLASLGLNLVDKGFQLIDGGSRLASLERIQNTLQFLNQTIVDSLVVDFAFVVEAVYK